MSCPRTWISCLFQTDQWRWERLLMRVDMCQHAVKVERRKDSFASEEHCQPHANALPLCLRTHVWNRLHDSRGSLEAGCGSCNWIRVQTLPNGNSISHLEWQDSSKHITDHSQGSKDFSVLSMWPHFIKFILWIFFAYPWLRCQEGLMMKLNCKETKPVNPKGNQPWILIGRTDAEAPILCPPDAQS